MLKASNAPKLGEHKKAANYQEDFNLPLGRSIPVWKMYCKHETNSLQSNDAEQHTVV